MLNLLFFFFGRMLGLGATVTRISRINFHFFFRWNKQNLNYNIVCIARYHDGRNGASHFVFLVYLSVDVKSLFSIVVVVIYF